MIEPCQIAQLNSTPIEMIAERLGLHIERHKSRCPWHDDWHPSLSFDTRRNRYRCYVCDAHGGVIDMVMNLRHCTFLEACNYLSCGTLASNLSPLNCSSPCERPLNTKQAKPDTEYLWTLVSHPRLITQA